MAISWSAPDGATGTLEVGIELITSDSTPNYGESVTITCRWYVRTVSWTFADPQQLNWSFNGTSGSTAFNNNLGSGQQMLVLTKTATKTANASAQTINASGNITGAYNGANPSKSSSITVPAVSGVPNVPATPTVSSLSYTSAKISWTAPGTNGAAITNYTLQYSTSSSFTSPTTVTVSSTSYTPTGLTAGTTYYTRVRANASPGSSAYSSSRSFTTLAAAAPSNPSSVLIGDGTTVTGGVATPGVTVSWVNGSANGSTGITTDVYVSTSSTPPTGGTTPTAGGIPTSQTSITLTAGVTASTTYYAWVRHDATTPSGQSGWQAAAAPVTTQSSGAQGDLVDRVNAFATQVGDDVALIWSQVGHASTGGWQNLSYSTGFADYGGTYRGGQYRIDPNGWVHLRGMIKTTTTVTSGSAAATLPSGFCPGEDEIFAVQSTAAPAIETVVAADGTIRFYFGSSFPSGTYFSLSGISFQLDGI